MKKSSNEVEFLGRNPLCSRLSIKKIDSKIRLKKDTINIFNTTLMPPNGTEERLNNVENKLFISPTDRNIYDRLKVIENKIIEIENLYPKIAYKCLK